MKKGKMPNKKGSKNGKESQATVYVNLKEGVLDPQGMTIKRALDDLGYRGIKDVRSGRFFRITLESDSPANTQEMVAEMADKLLANPVIEKFEVKTSR
jgi:phosphoribosylformylglycinamidine synthase